MKSDPAIELRPRIPGEAAGWFARFRGDLRRCDRRSGPLLALLSRAEEALPLLGLAEADRLTVQLLLEVLEDVVRQGWLLDANGDGLVVLPPDAVRGAGVEQQEVKRRLRASLVEARDEQLRDPAVKRFVVEMERPRVWGGTRRSVLDLFASPQALAADLRHRLAAPLELRDDLLRRAVRPYLQRVTDEPDEHTGLRLRDVWRYCRYTWSLPYNTQPGRRLHYLVRDAARTGHPIMGIGALGNSMVQITCRDDEIGWTLRTLRDAPDLDRRVDALDVALARAVEGLYLADFLEEGLLTSEDLAAPSEAALARLEEAADEAGRASVHQDSTDEEDLERAARSPRYRRKRAVTLRKWLEARRTLSGTERKGRGRRLLETSEGRRALKTALRIVKQRRVGTSMMDITTCGAIPPYGPVLGGKLAGLLLASPQVIADYRAQYEAAESHIASRMAGARVVRPPDLVLLCTTSLYYVGSSQYNRLRAPTAEGDLRYDHVGETLGYGSVHLSRRTYATLQRLLATHPDLERQSHRFAAGVNYKLRSIAAGLNFLGLGGLQKHKTPRLVYTVPLATNWREVLTGMDDEPEWLYQDVEHGHEETQALIDFWKARWFVPRVQRPDVLRKLEALPPTLRVSDAVREPAPLFAAAPQSSNRTKKRTTVRRHMPTQPTVPWTTLAELVGDRASFAERLSPDELEALHVRTRLDEGLTEAVDRGLRIYLSGNPGDGKTHIIRRYEAELEGVLVNLDASATDEARLVEDINAAIEGGKPAVIAVNEGPLRKMRPRLHVPDREELGRQLDSPFIYGTEEQSTTEAVLVNLGVRQVLERSVVDGVLNVALNRVDYDGAPQAVRDNHAALAQERVQSRLFAMLELAAQGGAHITMHRLFGFFAFVVTGGDENNQSGETQHYFNLVFHRDNPLYEVLRELDPAVLTHPMIDMQLWDSPSAGSEEWLTSPSQDAPRSATSPEEAAARFRALKRQYFFEARDGESILEMLPGERRSFHDLLTRASEGGQDAAKQDLLDLLATFFGHEARDGQAELPAWTGLRYNALGQPTALVADAEQTLRTNDVELLLPRLRKQAADLVEYVPNHVRLRLRQHPEVALDVDLNLWLELRAVQRGLPAQFRDPAMAGRVERFLAAVAHRTRGSSAGHARLYVRDVEAHRTHTVEVALDRGTYRL